MKTIIKKLASKISLVTYERMLVYSIIENHFVGLNSCEIYNKRESLWDLVIDSHNKLRSKVMYIEFGVYEGYSINYFSKKNKNPDSIFIGLDSFEGLPDDWTDLPKGTFSKNGQIPNLNDSRVSFVKGWFQNSWGNLKEKLLSINDFEYLIVHYDADLYSSTLFALTKIDSLNKSYIAIFDEFTGDEARALYCYSQAYSASVKFLGKIIYRNYPSQVVCRITPTSK